ncbi:MAG TPA: BON domain-containing protein [Vicinamibacterales bacterium]|nr:BON domain-containing protein [Vicinamibacterales bacterium]
MLNPDLLHRSVSEAQRTAAADEQLERAVVTALNLNVQVPPHHVTAIAHDGAVTLQGTVDWKYQRLAAESAARSVPGVRAVENEIRVEIS